MSLILIHYLVMNSPKKNNPIYTEVYEVQYVCGSLDRKPPWHRTLVAAVTSTNLSLPYLSICPYTETLFCQLNFIGQNSQDLVIEFSRWSNTGFFVSEVWHFYLFVLCSCYFKSSSIMHLSPTNYPRLFVIVYVICWEAQPKELSASSTSPFYS